MNRAVTSTELAISMMTSSVAKDSHNLKKHWTMVALRWHRLLLLSIIMTGGLSFVVPTDNHRQNRLVLHNFFKDLIDKAFENDRSTTGEIEGPGDNAVAKKPEQSLTETQMKWRNMNVQVPSPEGRCVEMDLYLAGVPNKDPSDDLYGSKVNISSRDRVTGLTLPEDPTIEKLQVRFLPNFVCECETETPFTEKGKGEWKVSDDGKQIRFRIQVLGYTRTVETKGSIQSIYWSKEPEKKIDTQTMYSIPAGWMYCEAVLSRNAKGGLTWEDGVLKIEQTAGLLGAGSKLVPCGKFSGRTIEDS